MDSSEENKIASSSDKEVDRQRDLVLWILKNAGVIKGRVRFQKMVFLGQKELGLPKKFKFTKYYYGPYSWELTETIEDLILQGDITEHVQQYDDYTLYIYRLSDQGKETAETKQVSIDKKRSTVEDTGDALHALAGVPLKKILNYVYGKFPTLDST
jgi:hypothetical protein